MDPIDGFSFAVRCFLVWNSRCRKMINQHLGELRSARILVPTPANLIHIGARPFADHVLQLAELRQEWLFKFITHDAESIRMPPEERTIFEAASIVGSWKMIAPIWPFDDIDGPQLIGLVDLEACNCRFLRQNQRHLNDFSIGQEHKANDPKADELPLGMTAHSEQDDEKPTWLVDDRKLSFNGQVARQFSPQTGKDVLNIISTFEECDWPNRIDDPLSPSDAEKTKLALRTINLGLCGMRFIKDGDGIKWEVIPNSL